jgi:hypothetical protein
LGFKIRIGPGVNTPTQGRMLIPNPDGIMPVDYCQSCGCSTGDLYWNGYQTICMSCSKDARMVKKLGGKMVDNGISLDEFFSRLQARAEIYETG